MCMGKINIKLRIVITLGKGGGMWMRPYVSDYKDGTHFPCLKENFLVYPV